MEYNVNALPLHTTFYVPEGHWTGRIIEDKGVRYMACYGSHTTDPLDCLPENEVIRHVIRDEDGVHMMKIILIEQADAMRVDPRVPFLRNYPVPDLSMPQTDFDVQYFDYEFDDDTSFFIGESNIGYRRGYNRYSPLHGEYVFYPTGHTHPDQSVIEMPGDDRSVWVEAIKTRLRENHAEAVRIEQDVESLIQDYGKVEQPRSRQVIGDIIEETLTLQRDLLHLQNHIHRAIRNAKGA